MTSMPSTTVNRSRMGQYPVPLIAVGIGLAAVLVPVPALALGAASLVIPLILFERMRPFAFIAIVALSPFSGLVRALIGFRYTPLAFDLGLALLAVLPILDHLLRPETGFDSASESDESSESTDLPWLAFALLSFCALWMFHPQMPRLIVAMEGFRKFGFMLLAFIAARKLLYRPEHIRLLLLGVTVPATISAVYGLKQFMWPSALDFAFIQASTTDEVTFMMGGHIRAFGTLAGPFHLGLYMVISLLLLFRWRLTNPSRWLNVAIVLQIAALVVTVTKSSWFALVGGLVFLLVLHTPNRRLLAKRMAFSFLALALFTGGAYMATFLSSELSTLRDGIEAFVIPWTAQTMVFRFELWQATILPGILDNWIFGYGTGAAGDGLAWAFEGITARYFQSHSLYFKLWLELGIGGLILFLVLVLRTYSRVVQLRPETDDATTSLLLDWALVIIPAVLVAGLTGAILDAYPTNLIFWAVLGAASQASPTPAKDGRSQDLMQSTSAPPLPQ